MSEPVNVLWGEEASLSSALGDALFTPTIGAETSGKHHHHHGRHHGHDQQKENEHGNKDTHHPHRHHQHKKADKGGKRRSGDALHTVDVPVSSIPAYPSPAPVITVNSSNSHFAVAGGETEEAAWHVYAVRPFRHLFSRKCPAVPTLDEAEGGDGDEGSTRRRPARLRRVCLLKETNVAVVQLGDHRVAVWDDREGRFVWEVQCRECVRNVGVTRDW